MGRVTKGPAGGWRHAFEKMTRELGEFSVDEVSRLYNVSKDYAARILYRSFRRGTLWVARRGTGSNGRRKTYYRLIIYAPRRPPCRST